LVKKIKKLEGLEKELSELRVALGKAEKLLKTSKNTARLTAGMGKSARSGADARALLSAQYEERVQYLKAKISKLEKIWEEYEVVKERFGINLKGTEGSVEVKVRVNEDEEETNFVLKSQDIKDILSLGERYDTHEKSEDEVTEDARERLVEKSGLMLDEIERSGSITDEIERSGSIAGETGESAELGKSGVFGQDFMIRSAKELDAEIRKLRKDSGKTEDASRALRRSLVEGFRNRAQESSSALQSSVQGLQKSALISNSGSDLDFESVSDPAPTQGSAPTQVRGPAQARLARKKMNSRGRNGFGRG
jgi:hypothetical protein